MKRNSIAIVLGLIATFFVPTAPAFAVASIVVDKPNGYVTAGQTVDLPMEISDIAWATISVQITAKSGSLTVVDPGSTLTLATGYTSLTGAELSFSGSTSDVISVLENGVSWTSPSKPASSMAHFKIMLTEPAAGQVINPSNGHTYQYVASPLNWVAAQSAAESLTVEGNPGYLATVTSASENSFVASKTGASNIWIGATSNESFIQNLNPTLPRSRDTCKFYWGVGPEAGTAISTGCGNPVVANATYNSYASGEPNNTGGEDCIVTNWGGAVGKWNDLPCTDDHRYLVEFDTTTEDFAASGLVYDNSDGNATDTDLSGGGGGLAIPNAPSKPTVVRDQAGIATISWEAPAGGGAVESYIVTASPGGDQCTVTAPALSCTIDTQGGPRTFAVSAVNATGESSASEPSDLLDGFYVEASSEDNVVLGIEQNDAVDVVTHAPIEYAGDATQTITTTWSNQSLSIDNVNDITYPEGWGLEYTTDGMTWSGTAPGSLSTVAGVRASGDVNMLESGLFTSSAEAESVDQIDSFEGNTGGDGFNVGFGNGILVNSFHHLSTTTISCHYTDGTACSANTVVAGYESSQNSSVFMDKTNDHMYQFVRRHSDGDYGVLCVDFRDETSPVTCATPFVSLSDGVVTGFSQTSTNSLGSPFRDGTKLWTSESAHNVLLCFDMATQTACPEGDNGFAIGGTPSGNSSAGLYNLRVAARAGKVFFTTVDHKMGCYDSSTHALCGGNAPIAITAGNRTTPVLIENTSGTFTGACDVYSKLCLTTSGTSMTIPSGLNAFWTAAATRPNFYIANVGALDYGITKHRLYWGGPQQGDFWSKNITCFDFSTDSACSDFTVLPTNNGSVTKVYSASIDDDNPKCVWVNQDSGKIVPINYKTGALGCSVVTSREVYIPVTTNVDRLGCEVGDEVLTWDALTITLPAGLTAADVTININDSVDAPMAAWQDVTLGAGGVIDLSDLDVADSGTNPIVHIIEDAGGPAVDLSDTTTSVLFSAGAPEVCVALTAVTRCTGVSPDPSSANVPDGIIMGESVIEPSNEDASVTDEETITLTGTNTKDVCAASLPGNPPDPPTNTTVTPGNGTTTVGWTPATGGSGGAATSYTVTDQTGLHSCTVNAPATSCEITGLTNGYPYVFSVVANNPSGGSANSPKTPVVIPTAPYSGNTLTIYFTSISSKLNAHNQSLIRDFINDHSYRSVTCTGSTQGLETIIWLAKSRSANACDYAKTVKKVRTSAAISKNKGIRAPLRSVVLVGR